MILDMDVKHNGIWVYSEQLTGAIPIEDIENITSYPITDIEFCRKYMPHMMACANYPVYMKDGSIKWTTKSSYEEFLKHQEESNESR